MVSIKTILVLNIILLSLALVYYFRVEITGFVSTAATVFLSVGGYEVELTIYSVQTSFCPGEQAIIINTIENVGLYDTSGNLTTSVFDPSSHEIFSEDWDNVDLVIDESKNFEISLDFSSENDTGLYTIQSSFIYEDFTSDASRTIRFKKGIGTLTASPPQIEKTISRGDSNTQTINMWLRNACNNTNVTIEKSSGDPGAWVSLSSDNVFLTPNILNTTILNITVPINTTIDDYLGQITLTADGQTIIIPLIIHVIKRDIEINVIINAPENYVCLGNIANASVNITKSNIEGEVTLNVTYQILDSDFVIVANSSEQVLINDSVTRYPSLTIPFSSSAGYHTYLVLVQYEEKTEQSSDIFEVRDCRPTTTTIAGGGSGGGGGGPAARGPTPNYSMNIEVSTDIISSIVGSRETLLATVSNTGNVDLKSVKLSVEGVPSTWIRMIPNGIDIPYSRSQEYLLVLNIPSNAASGTYEMKIKAANSRTETETKIVKLIVGKTLEELANLLLEEMEERRSIASRSILTKECLDLSEIIPIFNEGEKSRENGLNNYRSKNYRKAVDWFEHAINSYNRVIDQVDVKIQTKIDLLKNEKLGIFPIIGLKKELDKLEKYYLNRNYERICEPILEISRLKKLSLILWMLLLILIAVCVIILLIIRGRNKRRKRKEVMGKIRERLGEFKLETLESPETAEEDL